MKIKQTYIYLADQLKKADFLPLLLIRLILAYGFYNPAKMKWADINAIGWNCANPSETGIDQPENRCKSHKL